MNIAWDMGQLSPAGRATIANISPKYGATMGLFLVDHVTLDYLKSTGTSYQTVRLLYEIMFFFITLDSSEIKFYFGIKLVLTFSFSFTYIAGVND